MAQVVCVHGALRPDVDTPTDIARSWYPPLAECLATNGYGKLDYTLQCVWYTDLLRDADDGLWPTLAADIRRAFDGLGEGATVRGWLDTLLNTAASQQMSDWVVQLFLKQAWRYLNDPLPRAEARLRLHEAISEDTRVVIAHSLGSIVAWETLMQNCKSVHTLITIGSPLAMPQVICHKLQPKPRNGLLARPAVQRWVNIAHQNDWVAHPLDLQTHVDGHVDNFVIEEGERPHDVQNYLHCAQLAHAVAYALKQPHETLS